MRGAPRTRWNLNLAYGRNYGPSDENETFYSIVIGQRDYLVNHYNMGRCPNVVLQMTGCTRKEEASKLQ